MHTLVGILKILEETTTVEDFLEALVNQALEPVICSLITKDQSMAFQKEKTMNDGNISIYTKETPKETYFIISIHSFSKPICLKILES